MDTNRPLPERLREIHIDCLRLAAQHYSSKEIARKLGISKHTVDQRLRHATQELGASSRFDAARRFTELEGSPPLTQQCDPILYNAAYLSAAAADARELVSDSNRDQLTDTDGLRLEDAQTPYGLSDASKIEALFFDPVSIGKVPSQQLSTGMKSLLAVAVAAFSLLAFGAAVAALEVLSRI